LVEAGVLTRERVEEAVKQARAEEMKLGEFLVKHGFLDAIKLADVLCDHLRVERYDPERFAVDSELAQLIQREAALESKVVPLEVRGRLLKLGMLHPEDIDTLDLIEQIVGREVDPVICTEKALTVLMSAVYGVTSGLHQVMKRMDPMEVVEATAEGGENESI
jgi:type IV pilus assembly protein PilB